MMKMMKKLALCGLAALALVKAAPGQEKPKVESELGYTALESGVTDKLAWRNRGYIAGSFRWGTAELEYRGFHELDDLDPKTYFGRSAFTVADTSWTTKPAAVIKTTSQGVLDAKAGIRDTAIPAALGCYGFVDFTANKDGLNIHSFLGRELGKGFSLETTQSASATKGTKPSVYSELQLNKGLSKHTGVYLRAESQNFSPRTSTYLLGLTIKK